MVWCRVWLAVDVWLCTASIYNLCAISIDRYLAISRPVQYPTLMSSKRARLLIIAVWILSFVICFPPLIGGWNDLEGVKVKFWVPQFRGRGASTVVGISGIGQGVTELLRSSIQSHKVIRYPLWFCRSF